MPSRRQFRGDTVARMRLLSPIAGGAGLVLGFLAACGPFNAPTTSCTQDSDCGLETLQCGASGHCEERCGYPLFWCGDRCARCCDDQACGRDEHCGPDGLCVDACAGQHFCPTADGGGACAQCCVDEQCGIPGSGFVCAGGACACGSGFKACHGTCIPQGACCDSTQDGCATACDGGTVLLDGGCAP